MRPIVIKKLPKTLAKCLSVVCAAVLVMGLISAKNLPSDLTADHHGDLQLNTRLPMVAKADSPLVNGQYHASVRLFGLIPIAETRVSVTPQRQVALGGYAFGIKIAARGVMVIGFGSVQTVSGARQPAAEAGLKEGDLVLAMNGQTVSTNGQVQETVAKSAGKPITLSVQRQGKNLQLTLHPVRCTDGVYRVGMWVRDSAAGLGTMTFYDPQSGVYGGLGHGVCDSDTGDKVSLLTGEIVDAEVLDVEKAKSGNPGAVVGTLNNRLRLGNIGLNDDCGVFGVLDKPEQPPQTVTVAHPHQVTEGEATLYCCVEGTVKPYACRIDKVDLNHKTRNLVVTVTDRTLLNLTGGIVQGMSGSPIVQNGMLVGAVTHVFVNTPQKGYGVFAETMVNTAERMLQERQAAS